MLGRAMINRLLFFVVGLAFGAALTSAILATNEPPAEVRGASFEPLDPNPAPILTGQATYDLLPGERSPGAVSPTDAVTLLDVVPAVVRVQSTTTVGSGVVIDAAGQVLTSAHIVGDDHRVYVQLDGSDPIIGTVNRIDPDIDLALVQLPPGRYVTVTLGDDADIVWGAPVVAIGYPLNLPGPATVTTGVVSRVFDQPDRGRQVLQTDAAINMGSSGGPVLAANGRVIGIMDALIGEYKSFRVNGVSYAVSIKTIREEFLELPGE